MPYAVSAPLVATLTPWKMFLHADWVVQTIMAGLLLASVASWTVAWAKGREYARVRRDLARMQDQLRQARSLAQARDGIDPPPLLAAMLACAMEELELSEGTARPGGIRERVGSRLERFELARLRDLRRGAGALSTIAASAPFVGLFGTVWGIMNSFVGIADARSTHLSVVAPGIAEALLATALGLVAAVPAMIFHNHLARRLAELRGGLGDAAARVQQLLSRDLDRPRLATLPPRPAEVQAHAHPA